MQKINDWIKNSNALTLVANYIFGSNANQNNIVGHIPVSSAVAGLISFDAGDTSLRIVVPKNLVDAMPSGGTLAGFKDILNQYPSYVNLSS